MEQRLPAVLFLALTVAVGSGSCKKPQPSRPLVGVAVHGARSGFTAALLAAIERRAEGRAELLVMDGKGDRATQLSQVEKLIEMKAKVLVVVPALTADAAGVIAAAKAKGVPLVLLGREPRIEDLRSWDKVFFVGDEGSQAGALQGEILAASWKGRPGDDENRDGRMGLAFVGSRPDPEGQNRFEDCLGALERAGITADRVGRAIGRDEIADLIAGSDARIEAVVAGDDASASWTADALESAGRASRVPVVGLSLAEAAPPRDELEKGRLVGTVMGDATALGSAALDLAYTLAAGRDPTEAGFEVADGKRVPVPYTKVLAPDRKASR